MANTGMSKLKILHLHRIMTEDTEPGFGLTMAEIIKKLAALGIPAERKSIYADIETLNEFGLGIEKVPNVKPTQYVATNKSFTFEELTVIVDAIQSCRAITQSKAATLTKKVAMLAGDRGREVLNHRIHVVNRVKTRNKNTLDNITLAHDALRNKCRLKFKYTKSSFGGSSSPAAKPVDHEVTPVEVSYEDGFYYLVAWDEEKGRLSNFRLDRISSGMVLHNIKATKNAEIEKYQKRGHDAMRFGRFGGKEYDAVLAANLGKEDIITDCFSAASLLSSEPKETRYKVKVCASPQFFGWVASMNREVRIVGPSSLVTEYQSYLRTLLDDPA